jgi:Secretion system C-terminal sorting domain
MPPLFKFFSHFIIISKMKSFFTILVSFMGSFGLLSAQCPTSITAISGGSYYNLTISNISQCSNYAPLGKILNLNGTPYAVSACADDPSVLIVELGIVPGNTPVPMTGIVTITGITGSASCVYNNGVVPVELLSFTGKNTEGGNLLTWATAEEKNVRDFHIERSIDGQTFVKIGTVKANGSNSNYTFTDPTTTANSHYYRLKTNDLDGTATYSKVITLSNTSKNQIKVYPSVVQQFLTVETAEGANCQVFNLLGQQVLNGKMSGQRLDVSTLPQGTYFLKVGAAQAKFIKQ